MKLWNVPPLADTLLSRPDVVEGVLDALVEESSTSGVLVASALQGQGGIGKTVLAQLLAHDERLQTGFPDGIYWLAFGQQPDVLAILGSLILELDPTFKLSTVRTASSHLATLLEEKRLLLILDDVWEQAHVAPFMVGGEGCRFLLTTRRQYVAEGLNATTFALDVLNSEQSLQLFETYLQRSLNRNEREGKEGREERADALALADAVGHLPLALNLAVARVSNGSVTWRELAEALQGEVARLEVLEGEERLLSAQTSLEASLLLTLRALQTRDESATEHYGWFGVLPEDVLITPPMMATIWLAELHEASEQLERFRKESLLLSAPSLTIAGQEYPCYRLHDLFHHMAQRLLASQLQTD